MMVVIKNFWQFCLSCQTIRYEKTYYMYFFRQNHSIFYDRLTIFLSLWVLWINHPSFDIWPWHLTFDIWPYLCELSELGLSELWQSIGVALLHLTQSHVTDAMTHLTHVQQGRSQRLKKRQENHISNISKGKIQRHSKLHDVWKLGLLYNIKVYTYRLRTVFHVFHLNTNLKCGKQYNNMDIDMAMFENF